MEANTEQARLAEKEHAAVHSSNPPPPHQGVLTGIPGGPRCATLPLRSTWTRVSARCRYCPCTPPTTKLMAWHVQHQGEVPRTSTATLGQGVWPSPAMHRTPFRVVKVRHGCCPRVPLPVRGRLVPSLLFVLLVERFDYLELLRSERPALLYSTCQVITMQSFLPLARTSAG
jgi:hypothetical protein